MPKSLRETFGAQQITDKVNNFDFGVNERGMIVSYAPLYGNFNKDTLQRLSPDQQVMVASVARTMDKIEPDNRNFESLMSAFMQNPTLQRDDAKAVIRSDVFHTDETEIFKFDGSPDSKVIQQVHSWFVAFIKDREVLQLLSVGAEALARIVAQSGATVDGVETVLHKEEKHEKILDVFYLKFPEVGDPYFKFHKIRLVAWSKSDRTGFIQSDLNGITGDFSVHAFTYNADILSQLSEAARTKAQEIATGLFD